MSNSATISVFGAANVDITGYSFDKLIYKDANIGYTKTTAGGVGRNIAENLTRLDFQVDFISVFGDDPLSEFIINDCRNKNLNIDKSLFVKNASASTFIAIMDEQNDLALGLSAMELYDDLSPKIFTDNLPEKTDSEYVVLETNLHTEILQSIIGKYPGKKFVLDTVSGKKALRALTVLPDLYILKTNLLEAELMSDLKVQTPDDLTNMVQFFLDKGVKKVFITLGKEGVIYGDNNGIKRRNSIASKVVNTIGAGDSFVAGLIYADSLRLSTDTMALYGMKAASITVQHQEAVSPEMNRKIFDI